MNWAEHNLVRHDDVVTVGAWEKYSWLVQGFSLKSAGNIGLMQQVLNEVSTNRKHIAEQLGAEAMPWVGVHQVHDAQTVSIDETQANLDNDGELLKADGLATKSRDQLLFVIVADCVPILLVDTEKKIIAAVHSGRRGTIANIPAQGVKAMIELGAEPRNIQAVIGPSIGPCCYEVRRENIEESKELLCTDGEGSALYEQMLTNNHFDLWAVNELLLKRAGVTNIIRTDLCTQDHNNLFFSHRADEVQGRFAGLIGLT